MSEKRYSAIPILNIADFDRGTATERQKFVREVGEAYREIGFLGVRNHGIPDQIIANAYKVVKAFFALPEHVKINYEQPNLGGARGYTRFGVEHAKDSAFVDLKEFWHVGRELVLGEAWAERYPANVWPEEISEFKQHMLALYHALDHLGARVLRAVAINLNLPENYFEDKIDHGNSILRPIHYPPIKGNVSGVRSGQHEDINLITLLVGSNEPGLEVLNLQGEWIPVTTIEGTIVVNVGDMLQRLTNHVFRSTTHRVVNPPPPLCYESRYSIPFFLHPNSEWLIRTLDSCISPERPNRYPEPITADDYLKERLREIGLLTTNY